MSDQIITRLRQRHDDAVARRQRIVDAVEAERRTNLSAAEDAQFRALTREIGEYAARLAELGQQDELLALSHAGAARRLRAGSVGEYRDGEPLGEGQSFRGFARAQGLVPAEHEQQELSLRKWLRGVATGDWTGAEAEQRSMTGATPAAGGYLLPTLLSASVIDKARAATQVMRAGARVFPMAARVVDVPRWEGDPSVAWRQEGAAIPPSDGVIGTVRLTARSLAGLTKVTRELLEDAPEADDLLVQAFAAVVARTVDKVALLGSGTAPEPRGIKATPGIQTTAFGGANGAAPTSYDVLIDAVGSLRDVNEEPTAAIFSPRTGRSFAKLKASDGQPLRAPDYLDGVARLETSTVPNDLTAGANSDASDVIVGDYRNLLIGVRTDLQVTLLTEAFATTGELGVLVWWRGDIAVARPASFCVVSGIRP
ncbi:phage major capsid protein [Geodermatophilus ruber]|uniref:Phage major capsid protein, HK97 family n=1 Tax=Geodermatophilus ruber TaxID=504800 RepID=A0A1I3Z4P1_9ACTN|nr:phage major capsid protein [Geodermatophilus ruber]SFK38476.1 phage major capsid protein, HK97 family [Geodermatophilus ruber]